MRVYSAGKIAVPTPGTPVPVWDAAVLGPAPRVTKIRIVPAPGNTKAIYVGCASDFNKTTGVGLVDHLNLETQGTTAGAGDRFLIEAHDVNTMPLDQYFIDADQANEGAIVSYWIA